MWRVKPLLRTGGWCGVSHRCCVPSSPEQVEQEVLRRSSPVEVKAVTELLPKNVFCVRVCVRAVEEGRVGRWPVDWRSVTWKDCKRR